MTLENTMPDKRIVIGNDHGGYETKLEVVRHLRSRGVEVVDAGSDSTKIVRYPRRCAAAILA